MRTQEEVKSIVSAISEELLEACESGEKTFRKALEAAEEYWALEDKKRQFFREYCKMHRKIFALYENAYSGGSGFKPEDFASYDRSIRENFDNLVGSQEKQQKLHKERGCAQERWLGLVKEANKAEEHFKEMRQIVWDRIVEISREKSNQSR